MTAPRLHVHTCTLQIRSADLDFLNHVNNAVYFTYMEQARLEWLYKTCGINAYEQGHGPVIANASCNFITPLVYPGTIEVRMYLAQPGRSSVSSFYDIYSADTKYAEGAAKMVWIDLATGRSAPLPDQVTAPLRGLSSEGS
jgi:acyl-CoA thioester hydrolase